MATSGRAWLLGLGLGALVLGGCTSSPSGPPTAPPSSTAAPASAVPTATVAPVDARPCRVELPEAWTQGLRAGTITPAAGETVTVALSAADGTTFAVSSGPGSRHVFEWRRGAERGVVQDFGTDHPEWQVLGATYDGRHLAYRVDQSYSNFEDFAVYVWDSQGTRPPVRIARGEADADGNLMQTPFVDPVLADGWVYWAQTRDADPDRTVLSGYRISDGRTERLSRGYGRAPVRSGDTLVWADSAKAGQPATLRALDLRSRKRIDLPPALSGVRAPYYLAGNADTFAWVGGSKGQQLWVWRTGWPEARLLVDDAQVPQFPKVAGDVVVFAAEDAMYAADLRSWSFAQVTPAYGGINADGGPVVNVGYAATEKGGASAQALVDTSTVGPLGRTGC